MGIYVPRDIQEVENSRRTNNVALIAKYQQAQKAFDKVVDEIRAAQDPAHFLDLRVDASTILTAAQRVRPGHAIVYLAATPWGGFALAACAGNSQLQMHPRFAVLNLPHLNKDFVEDLFMQRSGEEMDVDFVSGFGYAREGLTFFRVAPDQQTVSFRVWAIVQHLVGRVEKEASTLDRVAQQVLSTPALNHLTDTPMNRLAPTEQNMLISIVERLFLAYELQRCLPALSRAVLCPLAEWLYREVVQSVTLIPCGRLSAFPLVAAEVKPGETFGDLFPASVAPSARSLLVGQRSGEKRSDVYTLGNPEPNTNPLPWSEAEALTLADLARCSGLKAEPKIQGQAKRSWLIDALNKGYVVDISCHGTFNARQPLTSMLRLAGKQAITLHEALNHTVDLRGLRLLILSACQTGLEDQRGAYDEAHSLAVGCSRREQGLSWHPSGLLTTRRPIC